MSALSGYSYITTDDVGENVSNKSLLICLQVPMYAPENHNVKDHKGPVIVPIELSNRIEEGHVTTWTSPLNFRKSQVVHQ